MFSPELQIYKCFGCGASGDIFSFVQNMEGIEFSDALEQLAEKADVKIEKNDIDHASLKKKKIYYINELTAKFYEYILLKNPNGAEGLKYLAEKRKLTNETIKSFELGYAPKARDSLQKFLKTKNVQTGEMLEAGVITKSQRDAGYIDKFRGRIIFPLREVTGKIVGFTARAIDGQEPKYLNSPETPVFHKNTYLYGLDKARVSIKSEGAVFVEGQMDVISAHQAGITNVIASSGTSLTPEQLKTLARYTDNITFCFDSDTAGIAAIYRAIELAEKQGFNIKVAAIPQKYKDIDELINSSVEKAQKMLKGATSAYDFFLADNLRKYDKAGATGKKQIMEALTPLFSKISNKILREHYTKELAEQLKVAEETIQDMLFNTGNKNRTDGYNDYNEDEKTSKGTLRGLNIEISKNTPESYFVSLLLKAEIDVIKAYLYNLQPSAFKNNQLAEIIENLKKQIEAGLTDLNIQKFVDELSQDKEMAINLYLWEIPNTEHLEKELDTAFKRLERASVKEQFNEVSEKMKLAEMQNDSDSLAKLTKEAEELKKKLI